MYLQMIGENLRNMANNLLINYSDKHEAITVAGNEIDQALKTISDIFKEFQTDYIFLLEDHKRLQSIVDKSNVSNSNIENNADISHHKSIIQSPKKCINDKKLLTTTTEPETPGIVENTQPEIQLSKLKRKYLEKNRILHAAPKSPKTNANIQNRESRMPELQISRSSPSKLHLKKQFLNKNSPIKSQYTQFSQSKKSPIKSQPKHMSLNKTSMEVRVLPSGKISRQCKLTFESVDLTESVPVSLSSQANNKNMTNKEIEQMDALNIDVTMFDVPFSQESTPEKPSAAALINDPDIINSTLFDEVIETSPRNLPKTKTSSKLSSKLQKNSNNGPLNANNEAKDCASQSLVTSNSRKNYIDKKTPPGPLNLFTFNPHTVNPRESPVLVNDSQFFSCSENNDESSVKNDESPVKVINNKAAEKSASLTQGTYYPADDTYCHTVEIMLANNNTQINNDDKDDDNVSRSTNNFLDVAGPSKDKNAADQKSPKDFEFEVGNMSEWDTDMSCEKSLKTPPKKRNLLDSFDHIPEKKKISPMYAYKGPVVRRKAERAKLKGWDCSDCEKYYKNAGLTEAGIKERKNQCSRHRAKFNPRYKTPPGFWNPQFPDTVSSDDDINNIK